MARNLYCWECGEFRPPYRAGICGDCAFRKRFVWVLNALLIALAVGGCVAMALAFLL